MASRTTEKPFNGGQWTKARFRQFIVSALRGASGRWGPKYAAINAAFVSRGVNPATGRTCKLHRCAACRGLFPQSVMHADHILPVVDPHQGFVSWDHYITRMFVEVDGYQAICHECHEAKSARERELRLQIKRNAALPVAVRVRKRGAIRSRVRLQPR